MLVLELLVNELRLKLEHDPTAAEIKDLSDWLARCRMNYLVDLENEIDNWVKARTVDCAYCDERHLPEEMYQKMSSGEYFCCHECKKYYKEDHPVAE